MRIKKKAVNAILVATGIILFWRGMWGLLDLYFIRHDQAASYVGSLVIGFLILVLTHHLTDI